MATGTAAVSAHFEKLFTGKSKEWNSVLKAASSDETKDEISSPHLMSMGRSATELDIRSRESEKDKKENRMEETTTAMTE